MQFAPYDGPRRRHASRWRRTVRQPRCDRASRKARCRSPARPPRRSAPSERQATPRPTLEGACARADYVSIYSHSPSSSRRCRMGSRQGAGRRHFCRGRHFSTKQGGLLWVGQRPTLNRLTPPGRSQDVVNTTTHDVGAKVSRCSRRGELVKPCGDRVGQAVTARNRARADNAPREAGNTAPRRSDACR